MTDSQQVASSLSATNNAMQEIISSAGQGQFQVTPEAGDELITIFQEYADYLNARLGDMHIVKRRTPLGDSPAGQAIADFNEQVATGGEDSFEQAILQSREQIPQVIEAIKKGIALYQEIDEGNATGFGERAQQ
ncbi:hypothetical protein DFQ14_102148 [Halopolyspora algeriensis]|uniref:PE family protein n=1 Tax=Halopolyspora algeriensis TaxID=1500506 RepID=A0A368VX04_9ACTN|nr:hypothetical protein [Halopolyspora algeriensis]RCW45847.1 hypothetical protein DFQ14_102148 [Halopolyspora algeriensis]TQM55262.1 hypothetical protein FHU43_0022 [Halopolyspora algeriensis]